MTPRTFLSATAAALDLIAAALWLTSTLVSVKDERRIERFHQKRSIGKAKVTLTTKNGEEFFATVGAQLTWSHWAAAATAAGAAVTAVTIALYGA